MLNTNPGMFQFPLSVFIVDVIVSGRLGCAASFVSSHFLTMQFKELFAEGILLETSREKILVCFLNDHAAASAGKDVFIYIVVYKYSLFFKAAHFLKCLPLHVNGAERQNFMRQNFFPLAFPF